MKLQRKILLPSLIAFAILMMVLRWLVVPVETEHQVNTAIEQKTVRLGIVSPILAEELFSGDIARIHEILENEENSHTNQWAAISLFDNQDLLLYPFDKPVPPTGIDYVRLEHKVVWSGDHMGVLILELDIGPIKQRIQEQVLQLEYLIGGIILLLLLLGAFWNNRILIRPVMALAAATRELRAGNFDAPLPPSSGDEIGELRQAFDQMRLSLKQAQEDAARDNEKLQQANFFIAEKNDELKQALEQAQSAAKAKSQFLAMMSHEIRTPMNGVLGMADVLLNSPMTSEQKSQLQIIQTSGESLLNILNDILDFSKIEAGQLTLSPVECDPSQMIEHVCQLFAQNAHSKGIELIPLPPANLKHFVIVDSGRLEQILTNLVSNAIKFTTTGKVDIRAQIVEENQQAYKLQFEVRDTGMGISPEVQKKLFNKFVQADHSTTRQFGGTGLGLAICKQLIELMGGNIGIESTEGEGTRVWFSLELDKSRIIPNSDEHQELDNSTHILLVDDIETNLELLSQILSEQPIKISTATSALQALDLLHQAIEENQPVDLLITDHMMPDCDGLELINRISQYISQVPKTLMLSSAGSEILSELKQNQQIDCFLPKPIRRDNVLQQIFHLLQHSIHTVENNHSLESRKILNANTELSTTPLPLADSKSSQNQQQISILLAEDVAVNQMVVQGMLGQMGLSADWAQNGQEAVDKIKENYYDLILMDIQMPIMDGYQASREIRQFQQENHLPNTPIIALTAHAMKGDMELCYEAGMSDYLTKPLTAKKLSETLQHWSQQAIKSSISSPITPTLLSDQDEEIHLINDKTVKRLEKEIGGDLSPIYDHFLVSLKDSFEELDKAVTSEDIKAVQQLSHRIKGSSRNLGLDALGQLANDLEKIAQEHPDQLQDQYQQLKTVQLDTHDAISHYFPE